MSLGGAYLAKEDAGAVSGVRGSHGGRSPLLPDV